MNNIKNFKKFIEKTNANKIIKLLDEKKDFELFTQLFIKNLNKLNNKQIEYILKIIFNTIVKFENNLYNDILNEIYDKIKFIDQDCYKIISSFISIYQEFKNNKINLVSICYQIIDSFKNQFQDLKDFEKNIHLKKNDLENINFIVSDKILPYYNSFFEVKYGKYFFKRIIDCKSENSQNIHTHEMVFRLRKLFELFGEKLTKMLKIDIIKVSQFWKLDYLNRISYFRIFYSKTNNFFKTYETYHNNLNNNINEIINLTSIDYLNYVDKINDTTSSVSYYFNEDDLEICLNQFDEKLNEINNNFDDNLSEYEDSNSEYVDTPIFKIDDNNDNHEIQIEDNDCSIDDLFVKN